MLRNAFVLLGLAVLLSLLFPIQALLRQGGIDPLFAAAAMLPALLLFRDAKLAQRIPRWSVWVALLALCSVAFLLLQMEWSLRLAETYAGDAVAAGGLPHALTPHRIVVALELAARLGVLVALVGVLLRLDAAPDEGATK